MQNLTLACFGPLYFALHIGTRPTTSLVSVSEKSPQKVNNAARNLQVLPLSVMIGFVFPTLLICLPSPNLVSYGFQQVAIAIWTPFPAWVGLAQMFLTSFIGKFQASTASTKVDARETRAAYHHALRVVYLFAFAFSAFVHVGTLTFSLSTVLLPSIFSPMAQLEFAPANLLFPQNTGAHSIGAGVLVFMQWDQWIGYTALLVWIWEICREEGVALMAWKTWFWQALWLFMSVLVAGPAGAAVLLLWIRDEKLALVV
jgi:hypothetical protein